MLRDYEHEDILMYFYIRNGKKLLTGSWDLACKRHNSETEGIEVHKNGKLENIIKWE